MGDRRYNREWTDDSLDAIEQRHREAREFKLTHPLPAKHCVGDARHDSGGHGDRFIEGVQQELHHVRQQHIPQ